VTGRVISRTPTLLHSAVTIDVGSGDGVKVDDSVLTATAWWPVAGRGLLSQVTLDHRTTPAAISAKVVPTRPGRDRPTSATPKS